MKFSCFLRTTAVLLVAFSSVEAESDIIDPCLCGFEGNMGCNDGCSIGLHEGSYDYRRALSSKAVEKNRELYGYGGYCEDCGGPGQYACEASSSLGYSYSVDSSGMRMLQRGSMMVEMVKPTCETGYTVDPYTNKCTLCGVDNVTACFSDKTYSCRTGHTLNPNDSTDTMCYSCGHFGQYPCIDKVFWALSPTNTACSKCKQCACDANPCYQFDQDNEKADFANGCVTDFEWRPLYSKQILDKVVVDCNGAVDTCVVEKPESIIPYCIGELVVSTKSNTCVKEDCAH